MPSLLSKRIRSVTSGRLERSSRLFSPNAKTPSRCIRIRRNQCSLEPEAHQPSLPTWTRTVNSSSDDPATRFRQPGETFMATTEKFVGRVSQTDTYTYGLGRWCYTCLSGMEGKKMYIVTAYRVSQESNSTGDRQHSTQTTGSPTAQTTNRQSKTQETMGRRPSTDHQSMD
eukprot:scaffold292961_cov59-Attheya_sp.AAC.3